MHAVRRRKLLFLLFIVAVLALASALVLYAFRQNMSLFYSPTQVRTGIAPLHLALRVGGLVTKGSVVHASQGLGVQFDISDLSQAITVHYNGILPDLFREGQGIVVAGKLSNHHTLEATEVLAKHDENYMPPPVKAMLARQKETT